MNTEYFGFEVGYQNIPQLLSCLEGYMTVVLGGILVCSCIAVLN